MCMYMYVYVCMYMYMYVCMCTVVRRLSTEALCAASFVARPYLCAQNFGMTFDLWSILSRGEAFVIHV